MHGVIIAASIWYRITKSLPLLHYSTNYAMHSFKMPKSLRYSKDAIGEGEGVDLKRLCLLTLLVTKSPQRGNIQNI